MPFIKELLCNRSVAIAGLAKNTGKTVCLNYVLRRLHEEGASVAVTSIGVDGEDTDRVTRTAKPTVTLYPSMLLVTSEAHYLQKKLLAEIIDVGRRPTALGKLVTARVLQQGKCLLSGPPDTEQIRELVQQLTDRGVGVTIVDGALSRLSLASPAVTDAIVLATGAAVSPNISRLIQRTKYVKQLIELPLVEMPLRKQLEGIEQGVWAIDEEGKPHSMGVSSVFLSDIDQVDLFRYGYRLYVAGAVSDKLLVRLRKQKQPVELIIQDFSRVFASQESFNAFIRQGNKMYSLLSSKLLAVTVNPFSPVGYHLNSDTLQKKMQEALEMPVYDVKQLEKARYACC